MEECHKCIIIIIELFSKYLDMQPPKCTGDEIRNRYYIHELRNTQKKILNPP